MNHDGYTEDGEDIEDIRSNNITYGKVCLFLENRHYGRRELRQTGAHSNYGKPDNQITDPIRHCDFNCPVNQDLRPQKQDQKSSNKHDYCPGGAGCFGQFLFDFLSQWVRFLGVSGYIYCPCEKDDQA